MRTRNRRDVLKGIGVGLAAGGTGLVTAQDQDDGARVRVVHASPDAPAVDVFVDGSSVLSEVAFGDVSDYLDLSAGTYTVQVRSKQTLGTLVFALFLLCENALAFYYYTFSSLELTTPAIRAMMYLQILETLDIAFLVWVTYD